MKKFFNYIFFIFIFYLNGNEFSLSDYHLIEIPDDNLNYKLLRTLSFFEKSIYSVKISPNNKYLAVLSGNITYILEMYSYKFLDSYKDFFDFSWSPDGEMIALFNKKKIILQNLKYKKKFEFSLNSDTNFTNLAWSSNNKIAISYARPDYFISNNVIMIYDIKEQKFIKKLVSIYSIDKIFWSPDNQHIMVLNNHKARIFIENMLDLIKVEFLPNDIKDLIWNNNSLIQFITKDGSIFHWNWQIELEITNDWGVQHSVKNAKFFSDNYIVINDSDQLKILNLNSDVISQIKPEHNSEITSIDATPNGAIIVTGSLDKTVKIWGKSFK